jgi:kynurenine formamidase
MVELIDLSGYVEEGQPGVGTETILFAELTHAERGKQVKQELESRGVDSETEYVKRHLRAQREGYSEPQPMNRGLTISEHGPTHVDSISHLDPTSDLSIDEMPMEWFYGDAICLDVSDIEYPDHITTDRIETELDDSGLTIPDEGTVLFDTGHYEENYSTSDYEKKYAYENEWIGLTEEAAEFVVEEGARAIGIDSISVDNLERIEPNYEFPVHALASREEIVIYENLANLAAVAGEAFTFSGMPLKIRDGTGSPVRPFAILE